MWAYTEHHQLRYLSWDQYCFPFWNTFSYPDSLAVPFLPFNWDWLFPELWFSCCLRLESPLSNQDWDSWFRRWIWFLQQIDILGLLACVKLCQLALFVRESKVDECCLPVKRILVMRIKALELVSVWNCFCKHICLSWQCCNAGSWRKKCDTGAVEELSLAINQYLSNCCIHVVKERNWMFCIILTAFICWTPASPPSHPEQCQPSQPKDVTGVRTNEQ